MKHTGKDPEGIAIGDELGLEFIGVMGAEVGYPFLSFNDPQTKTTIAGRSLEQVRDKMVASRAK